jgi:hypothetical protein
MFLPESLRKSIQKEIGTLYCFPLHFSFCSQAGFSYEDIHLLEALNNPNYLEHDA